MKALLLSFAILLSCAAKAQHAYIPIPEDSVLWVTVEENWHEGVPGNPPHTFEYRIALLEGKDTIFNGKKYLRLLWNYPNAGLPLPNNYNYIGQWIRQDTSARKVWYLRNKIPPYKEELLYDFSLNTGDTLTDTLSSYFNPSPTTGYMYPYKAWVDHIDSVFWTDGKWHYRWFITSNYGPAWGKPPAQAVQIEGMGYTTDFLDDPLLRYHPLVNTTNEITCFRVKDQWLYHVPNLWNADCDTLISRDILAPNSVPGVVNELEQPMLYPNPVMQGDALTLNRYAGNRNETYTIQGWNITGKQVLSLQLNPGNQIETSEFDIKPGIYFFRITNKQGRIIQQQKLMVQ